MLDWIVVETLKQAEDALLFLKSLNMTGSFIALDRVQAMMADEFVPPENCQRLFDLIELEPEQERYRDAFYCAMGNTVVCQFLETALKTCFEDAWDLSIITLDGQHLVADGEITFYDMPVSGRMMSEGLPYYKTREDQSNSYDRLKMLQDQLQVNEQSQISLQRTLESVRTEYF